MKLNKRAVKNTGPESTLTYSVSVSSPNAAITAPERFDPTTWLKRPSLELREFFPLMRGKSPSDSALPSKEQHLLHRALKAEIDAGTLPATRRKDDYAYLCSFIKCEDACHFAIAHQDDPAWNPPKAPDTVNLHRFCQKWAECRGLDWDALPRRSDAEALAKPGADSTDQDSNRRGVPPGTGARNDDASIAELYSFLNANPSMKVNAACLYKARKLGEYAQPASTAKRLRRKLVAQHPDVEHRS